MLLRLFFVLLPILTLTFLPCPAAAADTRPQCLGAGLSPDAPLFYLQSAQSADEDYYRTAAPEARISIEEAIAALDEREWVYLRALNPDGLEAFSHKAGLPHTMNTVREYHIPIAILTDVNHDGIVDFLLQDPVLQVTDIEIFAGCGDTFYTPVAWFGVRYAPRAPIMSDMETRQTTIDGVVWDEFHALALSFAKTLSHDDPQYDWAERVFGFDPDTGFYQDLSATPSPVH